MAGVSPEIFPQSFPRPFSQAVLSLPAQKISHEVHLSPRLHLARVFRLGGLRHFGRRYTNLGRVDRKPVQTGRRVHPRFLLHLSRFRQTVGELFHED